MHDLAGSMTELCHSGKHNNAAGKSIPIYYSSGDEAKLVELVEEGIVYTLFNQMFSLYLYIL